MTKIITSQLDSSNDEEGINLNNSLEFVNQLKEEEESILNNQSCKRQAHENNSETVVEKSSPSKLWIFIVFLTVVVAIIAIYKYPDFLQNSIKNIEDIKQIFPNQPNETFDNFETIIDDILLDKSIHPAVFLFLYEINEQKVDSIIDHLGKYACGKLESNNYIDVQKDEFHTDAALDDYGSLVDKFKSDIIEKKVMVVKNLQNIPAQAAQVFHSFCDEISPLVERVVYIFTLKVDSIEGKEEKIAESNLKMVWKDLDDDILMPLVTRVTSTVLKILN